MAAHCSPEPGRRVTHRPLCAPFVRGLTGPGEELERSPLPGGAKAGPRERVKKIYRGPLKNQTQNRRVNILMIFVRGNGTAAETEINEK